MLINADVKSLEVFVAADLSGDEVLKNELRNKEDLHSNNQERFKLPDRVTAKRFIFKLLYGAAAYGYSTDSDFITVGYSERQWQRVIDEFYSKYSGIRKWHNNLLEQVRREGFIEIPSGRYYNYQPRRGKNGWIWPHTKIKNYPVQGFGAEIVKLARVEFFRRFCDSGLEGEFICTIHDSLVVDTPKENVYNISVMLKESIEHTPVMIKEWFDYNFSLPIWCEIQAGMNKRDMEEVKFN